MEFIAGHLYDSFFSRSRIVGRLTVETPLRIGAGGDAPNPTAIDNPVIRDHLGRPFIPGSSFKGAWRSFAERVLGQRENADRGCCDPLANPCLSRDAAGELKVVYKKDPRALADAVYGRLCPACRIFGSPHFAGRLRVRDLLLVEGSWPGFFEVRPGVAIDRDTRTAHSSRKFEVEAVPTGTEFGFEAIVENAAENEWLDILLTLLPFTRGEIVLGGGTGRGLGRVCLREVTVATVTRANLRDFLCRGWAAIPSRPLEEACREMNVPRGGENGVQEPA